nr:hypothetical protein [Tanacetum cinerariifolium]
YIVLKLLVDSRRHVAASYWTAASDVAATSASVNAGHRRSTQPATGQRRRVTPPTTGQRWRSMTVNAADHRSTVAVNERVWAGLDRVWARSGSGPPRGMPRVSHMCIRVSHVCPRGIHVAADVDNKHKEESNSGPHAWSLSQNHENHCARQCVKMEYCHHGLAMTATSGKESIVTVPLEALSVYISGTSNAFDVREKHQLVSDTVNSCLAKLRHLKYLDLSGNYFGGRQIPEFIGSFKKLSYLNLSHAGFTGIIPHHIGNLSNLKVLDLSRLEPVTVDDMSWVSGLSSLEHLNLTGVNLRRVQNIDSFLKLVLSSNGIRKIEYVGIWRQCHLKELILSNTYFDEELESFGRLANLRELDLSDNKLTGPIPEALGKLRSLQVLDISANKLTGSVPEAFGKLRSLQLLDLHINGLTGPVPEALGKLRHLQSLDLSSNLLKGPIPKFQGELSKLHLDHNKFNGSIPESLRKLSGLTELYLQLNQLGGPIPVSLGRLTSLQVFSVSLNLLNGTNPVSFGRLSRLSHFDVFNNSLVGMVSEDHFANLSMLEYLNLAYNNKLTYNVSREWIPPFQLRSAQLGSCNISDEFPRLTGTLKNLPCVNGFRGRRILVQNNLFKGSTPRLLCRRTNLDLLDLSRNRLTGKIPMCFGNINDLYMMVLSSNRLSGVISSSLGDIVTLSWLHLNDNNFSGELSSFRSLFVLDLGENKFSGNLPDMIGENLMVLRLYRNNLTGRIPQSLCKLQSLQILDLAHNSLTGPIPHCFGEFFGMMIEFPFRYYNPKVPYDHDGKVMQIINGVALEYKKTVRLFSNMDLSSNKLVGEIPQELTALTGLLGLNLSHNHLNGVIPKDIGNMTSLFSQSITALTFLSYLNLSYNSLSGRIPTGNQLQTLTDPSLYVGNRDLCGAPLPKKCSNQEVPTSNNSYKDANKPKKVWLYVDITCGFATGFWGIIGVLMFKKQWRHKLFMFSEATIDKIHIAVAVGISKMKRGRVGA